MLKIEHLTKCYGAKKAVDDLSLHIAPGEICAFIGHNGAGIALAKGGERDALLAAFRARNARLADGTWQDGWADFCESQHENYERAVVRVGTVGEPKYYEKFAHYLDCEAHLDVWMQLFKTHNHRNER